MAIAAIGLATFAAGAQAPEDIRVALVIGNSAYPAPAALANPVNDADAMSVTLRTLGFAVVELKDASGAQMSAAIGKVHDSLKGKHGVAMLYYAGHGLQVGFRNFMVPVDAKLLSARDVPAQAVDLGNVIHAFELAGTRLNILVLDACRDNPFLGEVSGKGLAPLDAPTGTFLAYATAPGNVAEDGDVLTGNGLYTGYLVKELQKPAARIEDVFKRVRLQVRQKSNGRQIPWESTSLEDDFYFNDGARYTFRPADFERLSVEVKRRQEQLLQQAEEAHQKELQAAQQLALERERTAQAARKAQEAEQERLAAEVRAREAQRLSADAKLREQSRLASEAAVREAQRIAAQAQARERERELAQTQERERERQQVAATALQLLRTAEAERLKDLDLTAARARENARLKRLSNEKAREEAFLMEKADWERIGESKRVEDYYDFLKQYPSGSFSELAQTRVERYQKALVHMQIGADGKRQGRPEDRFREGDRYEIEEADGMTGLVIKRYVGLIQIRGEDEVSYVGGKGVYLRMTRTGSKLQDRWSTYDPPLPWMPNGQYEIGKKSSGRSIRTYTDGRKYWIDYEYRVVAREKLSTRLGEIDTYRMEMSLQSQSGAYEKHVFWYDPDWGEPIRTKSTYRRANGPNYYYQTPSLSVVDVVARSRGGLKDAAAPSPER